MLTWINNAANSIASWLGGGVSSFFKWLFSGLETLLAKVFHALGFFWGLLDSIWDFGVGLVKSFFRLFTVFLPFFPSEVSAVIYFALIAAVIAGIYKRVRGR